MMHHKIVSVFVLLVLLAVGSISSGANILTRLPAHNTNSAVKCATVTCNKTAPLKKKYCPACQKEIDRKEKERRDKVKTLRQQIALDKYESPEGSRIRELCGYEFGSVIKFPCNFRMDDNGNVIVDAKLKKPFRKCSEVELGYSGKSLALCWIKLYSKDIKGQSEDDVKAEIEGVKEVLGEKFKAEINGWMMNSAIFLAPNCRQRLVVSYSSHETQRATLSKDKRTEKAWIISLTLSDDYFMQMGLNELKQSVDTTSGLDAL